jgi:RsiW-degrading membrane proteinase PrsW (M82 family)
MNDTATIHFAHGIPPLPSLAAVLVCAALMVTLYQKLFPWPARWPLVAMALVLGGVLTVSLTLLLTPTGQRLMEITDLWSALRVVVLTVGLPEEAVKGLAALITLLVFRAFGRPATPAEAFQTALFAALGFAVVENALYAKAFAEASLPIAFGRGIIASFIHSLMMMIQGTFLMRFVATGWRRWHLPIIGWLCAAAAHAGFDWGMLKPLTVYLTKSGDALAMQSAIMEAIPVLLVGIPAPFLVGLFLFRRALKQVGDQQLARFYAVFDDGNATGAAAADPSFYWQRVKKWRRAGNVLLIIGAVGLVVAVGVAVYVAATGMPAPQTPPPDLAANMKGSIAVTAAIVASPAMLILGWLLRQKR